MAANQFSLFVNFLFLHDYWKGGIKLIFERFKCNSTDLTDIFAETEMSLPWINEQMYENPHSNWWRLIQGGHYWILDAIYNSGLKYSLNDYQDEIYGCSISKWAAANAGRLYSRPSNGHQAIFQYTITVTSWRARRRLKSPAPRLFAQPLVQAQIKENIKAPPHWPLWGESTGDGRIPLAKGQ